MIYPSSFESKVGFEKIRTFLSNNCLSELGREHVEQLKFCSSAEEIEKHTSQTEEFAYILKNVNSFPQGNYISIQKAIDKLKIDGYFLSEEELLDVLLFSRTLLGISKFFASTDPEEYSALKSLLTEFHIDKKIPGKIGQVIDERGSMKPDASPRLQVIRKDINEQGTRLRSKVNRILGSLKDKGFIGDDFLPTIRNGRMVLPVKSEYKRQVPGLIHDESLTGQTTYLEPATIFEDNNKLRELYLDEQREVRRILVDLSTELGAHIPSFIQGQNLIGEIDFIRSKAKLANRLDAVKPILKKQPQINIIDGRHPLLFLNTENKSEVVPLSANLDQDQRILIISGPNAGGKSVSLKTIGLLQYMLQCGLLIPVNEQSTFGIFDQIFADIGDDQSLENDLSTYSGHLTNMKHFLFYANKKTLFLIDEFGTGTDPEYGGVIADTVLEELAKSRAFGVITTHYENLKHTADKTPHMINGAMLFDLDTLNPRYELSIGKPGSSFALEIAAKIGLDKKLIQKAEAKLGSDKIDYDKALKTLDQERIEIQNTLHNIRTQKEALKQDVADYKELKEHLESNKKEIIYQAKREAKALYKNAEKDIEKLLSKVKITATAKKNILEERDKLKAEGNKIQVPSTPKKSKVTKPQNVTTKKNTAFKEGDFVNIEGQTKAGQIIKLKDNKAEVELGAFKLMIPLNKLEHAQKPSKSHEKQSQSNYTNKLVDKQAHFETSIDIRGYRVIDALGEVDLLIDNALMAGANELKILHGKGNGVLKDAVRQHLKTYPQVRSAVDEHVDFGGSGITIVLLD